MSLRLLIYYAKLMGITLDELVGKLEPDYKTNALDNALLSEIKKLSPSEKEKLLETSELLRLNTSYLKSELPASTTTALATMSRNSMSYTMSTGV